MNVGNAIDAAGARHQLRGVGMLRRVRNLFRGSDLNEFSADAFVMRGLAPRSAAHLQLDEKCPENPGQLTLIPCSSTPTGLPSGVPGMGKLID